MTNIELYLKIRELVEKKSGLDIVTKEEQQAVRDEILHFMAIGEDAITILEMDIKKQKEAVDKFFGR